MCLADMEPGQKMMVIGFSNEQKIKRRLQDLGLIIGTMVECIGISPLGDPAAYVIRKTVIALRKEDAQQIFVAEVSV